MDVIAENARSVVNELLFADDLVLIRKTMEDSKEKFWNWKNAPESKGLKVNTRKLCFFLSTLQRTQPSAKLLFFQDRKN